jgi:3-phenylpropionate/trans-cinnamate dioxygenase ferredoxin subunit
MPEAAEFVAVGPVDDLRPGHATTHVVEGLQVIVTVADDGELRVWDAQCPHADFQLVPSRLKRGCELECPMHGARFEVRDGAVTKGPAKEPLVPVAHRVEDGVLLVLADWL